MKTKDLIEWLDGFRDYMEHRPEDYAYFKEIRAILEAQDKSYPSWICCYCGQKYGNRSWGIATWHIGTCDICGEKTAVTEPRDFGNLKSGWEKAQ